MININMPRFNNPHIVQHSTNYKRKIIQEQNKINNYRKKKTVPLTNSTDNEKKFTKFFKFESQDLMGYQILTNENNSVIAPTIFGLTQKRQFSTKKLHEEKMWGDGPRVAIVGAGVAGLSAANHLISTGFTNFHIFEATPRLGGRVNTAKFANGGTCELGAEWLAGGDISNGLVLLANQQGLASKVDWRYNRNIVCMTSEGRALSSDICYIGRKIFNKVRREAYRLYKVAADIKHGTLAYFLDRRLGEELKGFNDCWLEGLQRLMCCLKNDLRVRWGAELGKMSSDMIGTYSEEPANAARLQGGLVNALLPLVRNIPQEKIHLNTPVNTVFWEHDKTSVVLESSKEVAADYIIVTVPLGFLKKNHESFFHPRLPKNKMEAIEKLGYGKVTKIYMKYPYDIWGNRRTEISTLWKSRDWSDREVYWYKGISCVHVQKDVAAVVVGGQEAECIEDETSDLIAHDLTSLLRCFLSATFLPLPNELLKSRWNTDIWNLGSGTYLSLDSKPTDPSTLAEPLKFCHDKNPKVLFAGEATCTKNLNSVHGARKSGIREAQRILDIMSKTEFADKCPC